LAVPAGACASPLAGLAPRREPGRDDAQVIIDTHTHVISSDTVRFPLQVAANMPNEWVHDAPLSAPELLAQMDIAGVHGAVLVQARTAYGYDNSYVAEARATAPERLAATAIVDMSLSDRLAQLRGWFDAGQISGVRLFNIPPSPDGWIDDPELATFVRDAHGWGVRVSACTLTPDLPALGRLLARVPEVPIAIDHCAFANPADGAGSSPMRDLEALAAYDNVRLKVTTTFVAAASDRGSDHRDIVEHLCESFGSERLMWGSDFPQYHRAGYAEIVAAGKYTVSRLSPPEQEAFLGGTALKIWPELTPGH
jgi:L-fuconolactonase